MYAKITRDWLNEKERLTPDRKGDVVAGSKDKAVGEIFKCKLYDDDNILYYDGEADDEGLEPLYYFGMHDAGVTLLKIKQNGVWVDCLA